MFGFAALFMLTGFWGFIGLVWYLDGFWMALAVALPFILLYKLLGRSVDSWLNTSEPVDPELNAFQQPLSYGTQRSDKSQRRKLPG